MSALPLATARLKAPYREWNQLLVDELFPPGRAGVPVYLAVHDGLLEECGARRGFGGRDAFVSAVIGLPTTPGRLFITLEQLAEVWSENGRGGTPPIVAGLAFAVLAASEMATDDHATQANYYYRLNALLGVGQRTKPERFEATPDFWTLLRDWLRTERRGELIVHGLDGQHPFVDPVQSQCLIRSCDLRDFVPVMQACGRRGDAAPEPEDVLPALRAWLLGSGVQSRLARILRRDPDPATLQRAAEALCDAWEDAPEAEATSPRSSPAERIEPATLAARLNPYQNLMWRRAKWLLRLAAGAEAEEAECLVQVADRVLVARLDIREPASYDVEIAQTDAIRLLRGEIRVLDDDGNDVTPAQVSAAWLRNAALDGRPGSWQLVEAPVAGADHALVPLDGCTLLETLAPSFEGAPLALASATDTWPGPGTAGAWSVRLREGADLPGGGTVYARAAGLRLQGGLRLHRRVYLRGALPWLGVSSGAAVRVEALERPDATQVVSAGDFTALDLPEGRYALECEGAAADLFVVEPRWRECRGPARAAGLDRPVREALQDAALNGAQLHIRAQRYAAHIPPGVHYRLYAPRVIKGIAPPGAGIHEYTSTQPIDDIIIVRRVPAAPPLPRAGCLSVPDGAERDASQPRDPGGMNRLLEYISARGTGSLDSVRSHCAAIAGDLGWHRVLSTLEDLGHVDVSWEERSWCASPACAVPRAGGGELSTLTGRRARHPAAWLREHGVPVELDPRANDVRREAMPDCVAVPAEALANAPAAVREAGLHVLAEPPSEQLAVHIRGIAEMEWWLGPQFSPPVARIQHTLRRWDPVALRWSSAQDVLATGLYQWREQGRRMHYLVTAGMRAAVRDPAAAKWFLLPNDSSYLAYDRALRRLLVPSAIELPRILKRVCTLASGLMPIREDSLLVYEDISLTLARLVATRLGQPRAEGIL